MIAFCERRNNVKTHYPFFVAANWKFNAYGATLFVDLFPSILSIQYLFDLV